MGGPLAWGGVGALHVGKVATSLLPSWGSPMLSAGTKIINGSVARMWAKWLHHPCRLGGAPTLSTEEKIRNAIWPTCRQSQYITPAVSGGPQRSAQRQK